MARVKGNFAQLKRFAQLVKTAGEPGFEHALSRGLGAASLKLFSDGFRKSRDPYGKPWKPLKFRKGKPLLDTGRMRASAAIIMRPRGFELHVTANYASTHQYGKKNIRPLRARFLVFSVGRGRRKKLFFARKVTVPRRQMLPEKKTGGLGPIWQEAFRKEAKKQTQAHFRQKRAGG
jgi:phage gpG-like protein